MKLNAQQPAARLNLYGLVQGLSYVIRLNDIRTVQHLRARLALVLRNSGGLAKPLHADIKRLFVISGVWVRNVGDRHQTKRDVLQIIRRILSRLNRPLARGRLERRSSEEPMKQSLDHAAPAAQRGEPQPHHRRHRG